MDFPMILGFAAATLTTGALFPQLYKTWKTRSASDLSLPMFAMLVVGVLGWLIYGILIGEWPVIIANAIGLMTSSIILFFKIRYG